MGSLKPSQHQPKLPRDQIILADKPDQEAVPMDVLFVGGGPAGLAGAIELANLVKKDSEAGGELGEVEIGVLEKAGALGEHNLSGAVVNPGPFRELFPDLADADFPFRQPVSGEGVYLLSENGARKLPTPPTMKNHGNHVASICEIVRWMGEQAEQRGINLFTGFPVQSLLVEDQRVVGVRTTPVGLNRDGEPGSGHEPATDLTAQVVALSEGTRGMLTQAYLDWQGITSENPQIYALGVKEVWEVKKPLEQVIHSMGWPLPNDAFGGTFCYPMGKDQVSIGIVVGMDYHNANLDVYELFQRVKLHPLFKQHLEGGELIEWGAKTIPEGGYYAVPGRRHGDGTVILGDAAGYVDVPSLKGVHYAVQSGIHAARAIFQALKKGDTSAAGLADYDRMVNESCIMKDLHKTRNMRLAFKSGFYVGGFKAMAMSLTGGKLFGGKITVEEDAAEERTVGAEAAFTPDNEITLSKVDAVFKSGNATRDDIPSHLIVGDDVSEDLARYYSHVCPAGVYEVEDGKLVVNPPNCIDCKATDVVGPRWTPREGGSGPKYRLM